MTMPKISKLYQESLANDVVAYFEREAFKHRMMDTATLYKFLLHVPSEVLHSYLEKVYENLPDENVFFVDEFANDYDKSITKAKAKLDDMFKENDEG